MDKSTPPPLPSRSQSWPIWLHVTLAIVASILNFLMACFSFGSRPELQSQSDAFVIGFIGVHVLMIPGVATLCACTRGARACLKVFTCTSLIVAVIGFRGGFRRIDNYPSSRNDPGEYNAPSPTKAVEPTVARLFRERGDNQPPTGNPHRGSLRRYTLSRS